MPQSISPGSTLPGHDGTVVAVSFSSNGQLLATGDDTGLTILWDLADPLCPNRIGTLAAEPGQFLPARRSWSLRRRDLAQAAGGARALVFSPVESLLASGHDDGTVVLWDLADPMRPRRGPVLSRQQRRRVGTVRTAAFSQDGRLLAAGYEDGAVMLWEMSDPGRPDLVATVRLPRTQPGGILSLAFAPGRNVLAVGCACVQHDRAVALWDVSSSSRPRRSCVLRPARGTYWWISEVWVSSLAFSPDGEWLVTACGQQTWSSSQYAVGTLRLDSMVTLWNVADPAHPSWRAALTQRNGDRRDTARRLRIEAATRYPGFFGRVRTVAIDPAGGRLATGGDDAAVRLWDLTDHTHPRAITTLRHPTPVRAVGFSPDGRLLVTGGTTVTLWGLA